MADASAVYLPARLGGAGLSNTDSHGGGGLGDLGQALEDALKSIHASLAHFAVTCSSAVVALQGNITVKLPDNLKIPGLVGGRDHPGEPGSSRAESSSPFPLSVLPRELQQLAGNLKSVFEPLRDALRYTGSKLQSVGIQPPRIDGSAFRASAAAPAETMGVGRTLVPGMAAQAEAGIGSGVASAGRAAAGGFATGGGSVGLALAAAGGVAALGLAAVAATGRLHDFSGSVLESQRHLAEVSPSQAQIFAESDIRDLLRNMQFGEDTAGSTKHLADAFSNFKDSVQGIKKLFVDFVQESLAQALEIITPAAANIDKIAKTADGMFLNMERSLNERGFITGRQWFEEIAKAGAEQRRRPMDDITRPRKKGFVGPEHGAGGAF